VRQDDPVLTWLPNGPDALRIWFAINYLGALYVPLNLAYRGHILEHAVRVSGARLIAGHPDLLPRLEAIDAPGLEQRLEVADRSSLRLAGAEPTPPARPIRKAAISSKLQRFSATPSRTVCGEFQKAPSSASTSFAISAVS